MERVLILNADDLGYDPAVTRGILRAMREGVVSSATLMVNGPGSEDAAARARGLALGLHFNLARWPPVSGAIPGELLKGGELHEPNAGRLSRGAVAAELSAQLDRLRALVGEEATHVDVHKHLHRHPAVLEGVIEVARARGLPVRSIDEGMRAKLGSAGVATNAHFIGDAGAEAYWTLERLEEQLGQLRPGVTELMCHPGYRPEQVQSGYAAQREVELETFLSPKARELLQRHQVRVADFRVLAGRAGSS